MKNTREVRFLVLVLASTLLMACVEVREASVPGPIPTPEAVEKTSSSSPEAQVIAEEEFNRYRVEFAAEGADFLRVRRHDEKGQILDLALPLEQGRIVDRGLESGKTYVYSWTDGQKRTRTVQISTPRDLEISEQKQVAEVKLFEAVRWGRLRFAKDFVLTTEGRNWTLIADQIEFADTLIQTFPEGQKAEIGRDGRSGGLLNLQVKRAKGKVHFILRGEEGGEGREMAETPARPTKAKKGKEAEMRSVTPTCAGGDFCFSQWVCQTQPGDGEPGMAGDRGFKGHHGQRGGDSGSLHLEVQDARDLVVTGEKRPGLGGRGGRGGQGAPGGEGGEPGGFGPADLIDFSSCRRAQKGTLGSAGPRGEDGQSGPAGQEGKACLIFGSSESQALKAAECGTF